MNLINVVIGLFWKLTQSHNRQTILVKDYKKQVLLSYQGSSRLTLYQSKAKITELMAAGKKKKKRITVEKGQYNKGKHVLYILYVNRIHI